MNIRKEIDIKIMRFFVIYRGHVLFGKTNIFILKIFQKQNTCVTVV